MVYWGYNPLILTIYQLPGTSKYQVQKKRCFPSFYLKAVFLGVFLGIKSATCFFCVAPGIPPGTKASLKAYCYWKFLVGGASQWIIILDLFFLLKTHTSHQKVVRNPLDWWKHLTERARLKCGRSPLTKHTWQFCW